MKKRIILLIVIFLTTAVTNDYFSQSGGRKREGGGSKSHGKFSFKRAKSKGHADEFARSKKKGLFARMFKNYSPAWTNRTVGTNSTNAKANRGLFRRRREDGHIDNQMRLDKQNARREKRRVRGNETFSSKKYKSR